MEKRGREREKGEREGDVGREGADENTTGEKM